MIRFASVIVCLSLGLSTGAAIGAPVEASASGAGAARPAITALPSRSAPAARTETARAPLGLDEMSAIHAGVDSKVSVLTRQQLTGTTTGNTVTADVLSSGDVAFSPDALKGFSGVGNFVINTGANNTLQGAINISIVTAPSP
ncbi:MAG: hypothetical protein ACHP9T_16945 [Caulobacterales bacterium]|jgi:hypothetical protein